MVGKLEQTEGGNLELWAGDTSSPVIRESTGSILSENRYRGPILQITGATAASVEMHTPVETTYLARNCNSSGSTTEHYCRGGTSLLFILRQFRSPEACVETMLTPAGVAQLPHISSM